MFYEDMSIIIGFRLQPHVYSFRRLAAAGAAVVEGHGSRRILNPEIVEKYHTLPDPSGEGHWYLAAVGFRGIIGQFVEMTPEEELFAACERGSSWAKLVVDLLDERGAPRRPGCSGGRAGITSVAISPASRLDEPSGVDSSEREPGSSGRSSPSAIRRGRGTYMLITASRASGKCAGSPGWVGGSQLRTSPIRYSRRMAKQFVTATKQHTIVVIATTLEPYRGCHSE
jgi:hypothetical protein